jgi:hypothetical protein
MQKVAVKPKKKKKTKFQKFKRMATIAYSMCLATIVKSYAFTRFATTFTYDTLKNQFSKKELKDG